MERRGDEENPRAEEWSVSDPVDAQQRAGLAEDADDLLDLVVGHPLADAAKHHQSSGLQRRVVLERKPGVTERQCCRWSGKRVRLSLGSLACTVPLSGTVK